MTADSSTAAIRITLSLAVLILLPQISHTQSKTYAERLGWGPTDKIAIFHVDDVGMSHESNLGAIRSLEAGIATSLSIMMPCSWVPEFFGYLKDHPNTDAGLHLTLTAEWDNYRWGPLAGGQTTPGLIDKHGYLHDNVAQVVQNATADEIELEIRAQVAKARAMGFEPTHLDSHMGTLFATPEFLERYIKVGVETQIPVMFPGGHNTLLTQQYLAPTIAQLKAKGEWHGQELPTPAPLVGSRDIGQTIWAAGLPVLDDLHNTSYGWRLDSDAEVTDQALSEMKVARYSEAVRSLEPGVTMIILHASDAGLAFDSISGSGQTRRGDMLAMLSPELRRVIEAEGVILSTFRELKRRRALH